MGNRQVRIGRPPLNMVAARRALYKRRAFDPEHGDRAAARLDLEAVQPAVRRAGQPFAVRERVEGAEVAGADEKGMGGNALGAVSTPVVSVVKLTWQISCGHVRQ